MLFLIELGLFLLFLSLGGLVVDAWARRADSRDARRRNR